MTYKNLSTRYLLSAAFISIIAGLAGPGHAKEIIPDDNTDFVAPEMYTHNEMLDEFGDMKVPAPKATLDEAPLKPERKDLKKDPFKKMVDDEKQKLRLPPLLQDQ